MLAGLAAISLAAVGTTTASARVADAGGQKGGPQKCTSTLPLVGAVDQEGTFSWDGATAAWPPNHKYAYASITLADNDAEPAADDVSLTVSGVHNEMTTETVDGVVVADEYNGTGNTDPLTDAQPGPAGETATGTGKATVPIAFRAERAGGGTGREYTFTASGTLDNGTTTCDPVTYIATVPHDMGNHGKPGSKRKRIKIRVAR